MKIDLKYRPKNMGQLLGQDAVKRCLTNDLVKGKLSNCLLFSGVRGTGKTTTARMIAKWVNCENPTDNGPCCSCASCKSIEAEICIDVNEVDAASNNTVDKVMNVLDGVTLLPQEVKKRVVILDEVHNLTKQAFDKILKITEEPPAHLMFILCTTERNKLPKTILSRFVEYEFKTLDTSQIANNLISICKNEGVEIEEEAARLITQQSGGSVRDSLTALQPLLSSSPITTALVREFYGLSSAEEILTITQSLLSKDLNVFVSTLDDIAESDYKKLLGEILNLLYGLVCYKCTQKVHLGRSYEDGIIMLSSFDDSTIADLICTLAPLTTHQSAVIKAGLLKHCIGTSAEDNTTAFIKKLEERISLLENGKQSFSTVNSVNSVNTVNTDNIVPVNDNIKVSDIAQTAPSEEQGTPQTSLNCGGSISLTKASESIKLDLNLTNEVADNDMLSRSKPMSMTELKDSTSSEAVIPTSADDSSLWDSVFTDYL